MRACWAVYGHSISTDEALEHDNCPKGVESWCKIQRALALQTPPPPHLPPDDSKRFIPLELASKVHQANLRAIFKLLARCVLYRRHPKPECMSFNSLVWRRCSKTDFTSLTTVQIAVNMAILMFNEGNKSIISLAENLGCKLSVHSATYFCKHDEIRIKKHANKNMSEHETRRKECPGIKPHTL